MTLSYKTIESLPIVDFALDNKLIKLLETSESKNMVYKVNAGKTQENVKHPLSIIKELDIAIFPKFGEQLLSTHKNSEFEQLLHVN
jgi:hypothetical protein